MVQAKNFLEKKEQVKVLLVLKGREKAKPERGVEFLENLYSEFLSDDSRCVKQATSSSLSLTLMPKKK